jgi:16S rRNA (guanine1516-N2)-methyltransferase
VHIYLDRGLEEVAKTSIGHLPAQYALVFDRPPAKGWYLYLDRAGLALMNRAKRVNLRLSMAPIRRRVRQGRNLAIARACDVRPGLHVLDALAGWGTDGLVLDQLGCDVVLTESNPMVFAMLEDLVRRSGCCARAELTDSRVRMRDGFDVIYLDPMFEDHPKTALPGERMQVLHQIGDIGMPDTAELLALARRYALERVVLKRRARSRVLEEPNWQIRTKSVRFDVYRPS